MNHKKLIIYEYDSLFNILNEIKENLNFELIRAQENDFQNIVLNLTSDFLVISKKNVNISYLNVPNLQLFKYSQSRERIHNSTKKL